MCYHSRLTLLPVTRAVLCCLTRECIIKYPTIRGPRRRERDLNRQRTRARCSRRAPPATCQLCGRYPITPPLPLCASRALFPMARISRASRLLLASTGLLLASTAGSTTAAAARPTGTTTGSRLRSSAASAASAGAAVAAKQAVGTLPPGGVPDVVTFEGGDVSGVRMPGGNLRVRMHLLLMIRFWCAAVIDDALPPPVIHCSTGWACRLRRRRTG